MRSIEINKLQQTTVYIYIYIYRIYFGGNVGLGCYHTLVVNPLQPHQIAANLSHKQSQTATVLEFGIIDLAIRVCIIIGAFFPPLWQSGSAS